MSGMLVSGGTLPNPALNTGQCFLNFRVADNTGVGQTPKYKRV